MKQCKKCHQSFFDEVEDCACGSKKFVYSTPPIIEPKMTKTVDNDDDLEAEKDYEKKAEEILRKKWGEPIRNRRPLLPLHPFTQQPKTSRMTFQNPALGRITTVGKTNNPLNNPLTNPSVFSLGKPLATPTQFSQTSPTQFPLSKKEADQLYKHAQSTIRQKSFQQYKRDQLTNKLTEEDEDE